MLIDETLKLARDGFYVTVGFGVIGFQKLQVRRRELEAQVRSGEQLDRVTQLLEQVQETLETGVAQLDDRVTSLERHVSPVLDDVESKLPPAPRDVVHHARDLARSTRSQVVDLIVGHGGPTAN